MISFVEIKGGNQITDTREVLFCIEGTCGYCESTRHSTKYSELWNIFRTSCRDRTDTLWIMRPTRLPTDGPRPRGWVIMIRERFIDVSDKLNFQKKNHFSETPWQEIKTSGDLPDSGGWQLWLLVRESICSLYLSFCLFIINIVLVWT